MDEIAGTSLEQSKQWRLRSEPKPANMQEKYVHVMLPAKLRDPSNNDIHNDIGKRLISVTSGGQLSYKLAVDRM